MSTGVEGGTYVSSNYLRSESCQGNENVEPLFNGSVWFFLSFRVKGAGLGELDATFGGFIFKFFDTIGVDNRPQCRLDIFDEIVGPPPYTPRNLHTVSWKLYSNDIRTTLQDFFYIKLSNRASKDKLKETAERFFHKECII